MQRPCAPLPRPPEGGVCKAEDVTQADIQRCAPTTPLLDPWQQPFVPISGALLVQEPHRNGSGSP